MLIKREEYYVEYFDTEKRRYYSIIFPMIETAEEFQKSMLSSPNIVKAEIKKQEYFYEET